MENISAAYAVTTGQNPHPETVRRARAFAQEHKISYMQRSEGIATIGKTFQSIFVFTAHEMYLWHQGHEIRFHTNMAKHRILNLMNGGLDRMQAVMELKPGDSVLDCTLGLGTDAIVASFIVGACGKVTGLEPEYPLYLLISHGLRMHVLRDKDYLIEPMRRIETIHEESLVYLKSLGENVYDTVYFDPMFRSPGIRSQGLHGLRVLSNPNALTEEHIQEALRVAAKGVILKERPGSREFMRLGFSELPPGRGASVSYGVIRL